MLYTPKIITFIAISFCFVCLIKADKIYELQLNKYLIANLEPEYGILKQDLQKGEDRYTFINDINNTTKDGVEMDMTWENGYKFSGVYFCKNEKMDQWKNLIREIFYTGFSGHKCPFPKDKEMKLKNSFTVESKLKEDISGTVFISLYIEYEDTYMRTVRYDLVGTAKAK